MNFEPISSLLTFPINAVFIPLCARATIEFATEPPDTVVLISIVSEIFSMVLRSTSDIIPFRIS